MTNHPNRSKRACHMVKLDTFPNQEIYRLTADWAGLDAGTEISPSSAGNNAYGESVRTVVVQSGPRKGELVTGPY